MFRFIVRRLINIVISLVVLASATFFLMKAVPGNPFLNEKNSQATIDAMMKYYGLDKPLWQQYLTYMKNLFQGELGESLKTPGRMVTDIISQSFGNSLKLGLVAVVVSVIVGVALGMIAAMYNRKLIDKLAVFIAILGISIPNFVVGSVMQYLLGVKVTWFNVAGLAGPMDYVLPTIALSALPIAFITRLTRSSMLEVLTADYIRTAKAKGLSPVRIVLRHGLRNAILPVVTYLGPMSANVITGSVVVEKIYSIAGLGKFFTDSIANRDYPLIMGITLFYAIILMVARFLADIGYALVDPRMKKSKGG
ncbi:MULTISPECIES: ABC transporter permease [unclassified Paenibacillus]|uniref:ABC transporter permease n=1 Tax=unclassified Paenibacillus TaxID=185978 RepID=UPI00095415E6|nr:MULTISPECIES: ABC transporter permease [unclassified Paenibacillus]ASS68049.1 ABC transporter permease [Paenibacillus sp. RUD330]SIR40505.1 oligopeptide transport system permease protein [Paenibacillus sp. RU4X]SIR50691.1 oligopeptide transport system permease protein [Paenibacillus sp. RU4T]